MNILGIEMTADEANRLKEWLQADSGRKFWEYIGNSRQAAYDQFIGHGIDNPIREILDTQRQKAIMGVYDEILGIPGDVKAGLRKDFNE